MIIIRNPSSSVYKPISIIRTSRHPSSPHIPFRALATTSTRPAPGRAFSAATTTSSALDSTRDLKAFTTTRMFATSAYRADQPKTYSLQPKVPRLPVPDLEKSLEAYFKSLIPVMEQKYDPSAIKKELSKRQLYIRDFISPTGLGQTLQNRLLDLDHVSPNNWLNDTLWLALAYHTWRAPLIVNSNWWLMFGPDPSDPEPPVVGVDKVASTPENNPTGALAKGEQGGGQEWIDKNPKGRGRIDIESQTKWADITDYQVAKAAWIVRRFAEFREKLAKEEIAPDATKAGPLCMEQYRKLFNFARVPLPGCDAFSRAAPQAVHISLLIDDLVYSVDVCEPGASVTDVPKPLPVVTIKSRIRSAVEDARKVQKQGGKRQRVGVLTADERDTWTINREKLIAISPSNRSVLESLSTSMFALSLDNYTLPSIPPQTPDPLYLPAIDAQVRNAGTGIHGGQNRWFDKAISVVVETNGRAGVMGEHSPVDALIPSIVVEYVLAEPVPPALIRSESSDNVEPSQEGWQSHKWTTDEEMDNEIQAAQRRAQKIVLDSDASQLWWNEYGTEWIKKNAKCAPDAYIQQALQLAWFREQGYATATYESGSTRGLLHGRTDVIRTLTEESRECVKSMQDDTADAVKRYASLSKACQTHSNITRTVSAGHGFDRHLMGLKTRLRPGETHALFEDELYAKSQEWKLSTSGLSAGGQFTGTGFGAAWPDGYGINYLAGPYLFKFGIESKYSNEATSTSRFKHHIVQALRDMREVCEAALGEQTQQVKAKL